MHTMNKKVSLLLSAIASITTVVSVNSCGEEKTTPPLVTFRTSSVYVSVDTTIYRNTVFNIGIEAKKTGTDGLLSGCTIQRSSNGGADSTIQQMSFVTQYFSQFYSYLAPDSGNADKYTFTVTERDGSSSSVSVTVTGN